MYSPKTHPILKVFAIYFSAFMIIWPVPVAFGNPTGGSVVSGSANIQTINPQLLQIQQSSDRAVINWGDFSIAAGETTQFIQPGVSSATLNRVTGGNVSEIYGNLTANGQIFLVNPNGLVVGPSGIINAAAFTASTLDLSNSNFMNGGNLLFKGDSAGGEIHNMGQIKASSGDIFLIGRTIKNDGLLSAPSGTVGLAAGYTELLLKESGSQRMFVRVKKKTVEKDSVEEADAEEASTETETNTETVTTTETVVDEETGEVTEVTVTEEVVVEAVEEVIEVEGVVEVDAGDIVADDTEVLEAADEESASVVEALADIEEGIAEELDENEGLVEIEDPETGETYLWKPVGQSSNGTVGSFNSTDAANTSDSTDEVGSEENQILNTGTIEAVTADLIAAGGNIYALAINNEGIIRATGTEVEDGVVRFVGNGGNIFNSGEISAQNADGAGGDVTLSGGEGSAVVSSGVIDASGTTGGYVEVTGSNVGLIGKAEVDVSGTNGGGTALIGGDYQGKNSALQNAEKVYVDKDVKITADAVEEGDGGKVVLWADNTTKYFGEITADGGANSGNGGFVEVSGKKYLEFRGDVSTFAENGDKGLLLLDPTDITIASGSGDSAADGTTTFQGDVVATIGALFDDGAGGSADDTGPSTIYESELEGIAAATDIILQATNDITINDLSDDFLTLDQTGSVSFMADADGDNVGQFIMLGASDVIHLTGGANLNIHAGGDVTMSGVITTGGVNVSSSAGAINSSGSVTAGGLIYNSSFGFQKV